MTVENHPVLREHIFMPDIKADIEAFEQMRRELELEHVGKWVLIHDRTLIGVYDSFDSAAKVAVERFGRGPYLIRQVGAPDVTLPASLMYHPVHA